MRRLQKLVRKILGRKESEWALRIERDNNRVKKLLPEILSQTANCIDIGSHNGMYLEFFLSLSPRGWHTVFEPLPSYYNFLKEKFPNVTIHNEALSDFNGTATFYNPKGAEAMSGLRKQCYPGAVALTEFEVQVRQLDQMVSPNVPVSFIKIDVEGAELSVLKGAVELIKRDRPAIIFEFAQLHAREYGTTAEEMFDFFNEVDYCIYRLDREGKFTREKFVRVFNEAHESGYNRAAETNFLAMYESKK